MKRILLVLALSAAAFMPAFSQTDDVLERVAANPDLAKGYNYVQYFGHSAYTKAPKGYKPFYISHYARHGARYAWEDIYLRVDTLLKAASVAGELTPYGESVLSRVESLIEPTRGRVGELTPVGWKQHTCIADNLMNDFPEVFDAGARVFATSTPVNRVMMSMSSCCMEIARRYPKLDIYEDMSVTLMSAVNPTHWQNPDPRRYGKDESPYHGATLQLDPDILAARIFKDISYADGHYPANDMLWDLYTLYVGMSSLGDPVDFSDLFTTEELVSFWQDDNLNSFIDGYVHRYQYYPIVEDIVARAEDCIASGKPAVDMRFGHDFIVQPLLVLMNIDGNGHIAGDPELQCRWYQNYNVCMACNFQFVLYRSKKCDDILFKVILNGEEATMPDLEPVSGPYYKWADFVEYAAAIGRDAQKFLN